MILQIIIFSGISGATIFIGGLLSNYFEPHIEETPVKPIITHFVMALGGGIILSALALVLIPKGMEELELVPLTISFGFGAILFYFIDRWLAKMKGSLGTLLAMLLDFIPESIVLGAVFATDTATATLLSIFIGLQNLPEAFNAFRDVVLNGLSVKTTLVIFFFLSFLGIIGALLGHFLLSNLPQITAHLMIFASGGILYLSFQDIIPETKLQNSYVISLGGTLGFLIGIIGEKLI
jgi:ZIP family zinc transporter